MVSLFQANPPADFPTAVYSPITLVNHSSLLFVLLLTLRLYQSVDAFPYILSSAIQHFTFFKKKTIMMQKLLMWVMHLVWTHFDTIIIHFAFLAFPSMHCQPFLFFLFNTFTACAVCIFLFIIS